MKAVFSKADSVIAWIGPSNRYSDKAMKHISKFTDPSMGTDLRLKEAEFMEATTRKSVYDLFKRLCWGRVWIL